MLRYALSASLLAVLATGCGDSEDFSELALDVDALLAEGYERHEFPDPDPGIPAYARVSPILGQFFHDDGWLAIPLYRDPACLPADFNLLEFFDFPGETGPGAFGCPLTVSGFALLEPGSELGTFPRITIANGNAVPFWFVRWADFEAAMASGSITFAELEGMERLVGTATSFDETLQPRMDAGEHLVMIDAVGQLDDGRAFSFHVVHLEDETLSLRLSID
jgi:hypothetical protein